MKLTMLPKPDRLDLFAILLLTAIIPAMFGPLLSQGIRGTPTIVPQSDFPPHSVLAAELRAQRQLMIPHPLYHLVLIGVQCGVEMLGGYHQTETTKDAIRISRGEVDDAVLKEVSYQYSTAAIITNAWFVWLLSLILWIELRAATGIQTRVGVLAIVAMVIGLLVLTPVALFHAMDGRYYFGYIGINVWHNPTVISAKPFVLLTFLATLAGFPERSELEVKTSIGKIITFALIVVVGAMAKPSFIMCLLPAVLLLAICRSVLFGQPVRWVYLGAGLFLPTIGVLAWQSWIYSRYTGGAHAIFSPLATMSAMSRHLGPKLLLSIVFPVVCYIAWWPAAKSRVRLNLAWLAFIAGLFLTYFVAETKRTRHGNFLWSAQLALFVLFVESAIFCIERARVKKPDATYETIKSRRTLACAMAFAAHVIFGLIYDVHLVSTHGDSSWLTASWWYH